MPSAYQGRIGYHNPTKVVNRDMPHPISRLLSVEQLPMYDPLGMGRGNEDATVTEDEGDRDDAEIPTQVDGNVKVVRKLGYKYFRGRLVKHFDIQFKRNKIKRPSRADEAVYFKGKV